MSQNKKLGQQRERGVPGGRASEVKVCGRGSGARGGRGGAGPPGGPGTGGGRRPPGLRAQRVGRGPAPPLCSRARPSEGHSRARSPAPGTRGGPTRCAGRMGRPVSRARPGPWEPARRAGAGAPGAARGAARRWGGGRGRQLGAGPAWGQDGDCGQMFAARCSLGRGGLGKLVRLSRRLLGAGRERGAAGVAAGGWGSGARAGPRGASGEALRLLRVRHPHPGRPPIVAAREPAPRAPRTPRRAASRRRRRPRAHRLRHRSARRAPGASPRSRSSPAAPRRQEALSRHLRGAPCARGPMTAQQVRGAAGPEPDPRAAGSHRASHRLRALHAPPAQSSVTSPGDKRLGRNRSGGGGGRAARGP